MDLQVVGATEMVYALHQVPAETKSASILGPFLRFQAPFRYGLCMQPRATAGVHSESVEFTSFGILPRCASHFVGVYRAPLSALRSVYWASFPNDSSPDVDPLRLPAPIPYRRQGWRPPHNEKVVALGYTKRVEEWARSRLLASSWW
jgi:hypothetical protein